MVEKFGKGTVEPAKTILKKQHPENLKGVTMQFIETEEVKCLVNGISRDELNHPEQLPFNLKQHRDVMIKLLKRVQEYGVKSDVHLKKPYLYTGSWMERIHSLEDLMAHIEA